MKLWSIIKMMFQALINPKRYILMPEIPTGRVLDIGGGGEGVIARIGGNGVIAIDKYMSEIREARGKASDAAWMVADGTKLPYPNHSMDQATAFFSCMYMSDDVKETVFRETRRVLKPDGEFWIWDVPMTTKSDVFAFRLKVENQDIPTIRTIYGVKTKDQSAAAICNQLQEIGFETDLITNNKDWFFIKAKNI
jgi:ubiquinone/menaquinone biosynthesis C-methylase UbiE